MTQTTIPARHGKATFLKKGQTIKVINTHGTQVVDTFAFTLDSEKKIVTQMSMQHLRACLNKIIPAPGDGLFNNRREKILTLTEDTTPGIHDTVIAACDEDRYTELAGEAGKGHRNCADNLVEGLAELGIEAPQFTPSPFNLFMNIPIHTAKEGEKRGNINLSFEAPTSEKGQYVCLKAEVDCVVAFSACPQDILDINCKNPVDAHFEILD
ncbi:hypothetical protein B0J14DRAFT_588031 [Halenospora varia]|nr:hypothetical protein B0J14DRAFT_588031 [Halenospora varia]